MCFLYIIIFTFYTIIYLFNNNKPYFGHLSYIFTTIQHIYPRSLLLLMFLFNILFLRITQPFLSLYHFMSLCIVFSITHSFLVLSMLMPYGVPSINAILFPSCNTLSSYELLIQVNKTNDMYVDWKTKSTFCLFSWKLLNKIEKIDSTNIQE